MSNPPPASSVREVDESDKLPTIDIKTDSNRFKRGSRGSTLFVNVVVPLLLLGVAAAAVWALGTVEPEKRPPLDVTRTGRMKALAPVRVERLMSLEETGAKLNLDVDGTVIPYREARVAAEVAGRVVFKSEKCETGQYVQEGELLMKIDATDYELQVEELTRQKEQAYQSLKELDQEMANAQRLIEVAKDDIRLQQREFKRQQSLPPGFGTAADLEQAEKSVLTATQTLISQENQLDLLKQRRTRLEASERLAQIQLRGAEVNLERTQIRAPIEGVIAAEEADLNTFVARGTTLVVIDDTSKVEVASSLRMDQLYWILDQKGTSVDEAARGYELPETPAVIEYELSGRDGVIYRWNGKLLSYNGIGLDSETRTVPVRVVVDKPRQTIGKDGKERFDPSAPALVRGMYVQVKLFIDPKTPLVVIPAQAMQPGNRVYHFTPDESVLQPPTKSVSDTGAKDASVQDTTAEATTTEDTTAEADNDEGATDASDLTEETIAESEDGFVASEWVAGRVQVESGVTPVDSLSIANLKLIAENKPTFFAPEVGGEDRLWVCEVTGDNLKPGAMVVVSPIGTVDGEFLPARAQLKQDEAATTNQDNAVQVQGNSRTRDDQESDSINENSTTIQSKIATVATKLVQAQALVSPPVDSADDGENH
ncbi:Multidrug resistance protein MdtA precursor [Rubripirellula amarantea]|uniref:Multidrug resistance protein MdtA n=1 Tax=Rubripirellula amarantea TaxID=2527999 RepID=A0A5C5WK82_9BACT|nr:HlyD family efflux transporter periplasmic adaptor subunit [Rubripirellula amarantea]TWT50262.1 Multidrug resistance protein MdtA precursor [Rubripirellula amarantea]